MSFLNLVEASAATLGIAAAIVVALAVLEWAMPDADLLGHDLDEQCRRCDHASYRCGLCSQCYELAVDSAYTDGEWD